MLEAANLLSISSDARAPDKAKKYHRTGLSHCAQFGQTRYLSRPPNNGQSRFRSRVVEQ